MGQPCRMRAIDGERGSGRGARRRRSTTITVALSLAMAPLSAACGRGEPRAASLPPAPECESIPVGFAEPPTSAPRFGPHVLLRASQRRDLDFDPPEVLVVDEDGTTRSRASDGAWTFWSSRLDAPTVARLRACLASEGFQRLDEDHHAVGRTLANGGRRFCASSGGDTIESGPATGSPKEVGVNLLLLDGTSTGDCTGQAPAAFLALRSTIARIRAAAPAHGHLADPPSDGPPAATVPRTR